MSEGSPTHGSTMQDETRPDEILQNADTSKPRSSLKNFSRVALILTTILVACVCLPIPRAPVTTDRESSWGAVLVYAHEKGLQFGPQIVFTYGPLGFLSIPYFAAHAAPARLATDCILSLLIAAGVCLLAWRLPVLWRCLLLALLMVFVANLDLKLDLLVDFGLLCWALLCFASSGPRLLVSIVGFMILAVFTSLGKFTYLCNSLAWLLAISSDLALRGKARLGVSVLAGAVLVFLLTWVALGQKIAHIVPFLANSLLVAKGYNAMALEGPLSGNYFGLLVAILGLGVISIRSLFAFTKVEKNLCWRRGLLLATLTLFLFLSWKHAFVRADRFHIATYLTFVPMLALALGILASATSRVGVLAQSLAILCVLVSFTTLQTFCFRETVGSSLRQPASLLASNVTAVVQPAKHLQQMRQALETESTEGQLPKLRQIIGPNTVDVFGSYVSYALFNRLNYTPRPMFLSTGAYSSPLNRLNEQFFLSGAAPEYALFRLGPIDHRFPPLEDSMALRVLLINYDFVDAEGEFLLLKQKSSIQPSLTLLHEGTVHSGEKIDLTSFGTQNLWMEIDLKPTFRGQATGFFSHLAGVRLAVWVNSTQTRPMLFRAPPEMLSSGFIASPLILTNQHVEAIYQNQPTRPVAYSVDISRDSFPLWNGQIHFRLFKIENALGGALQNAVDSNPHGSDNHN